MAEYLCEEDMSTGEYISREKAIKELREVYENEYPTASGDFDEYASHDVPNVLRNIPSADVQPVKRGEWKYYKNTGIFDIHKCSVCATPFELPMDIVPSSVFCFCPHCGARMDGDTE